MKKDLAEQIKRENVVLKEQPNGKDVNLPALQKLAMRERSVNIATANQAIPAIASMLLLPGKCANVDFRSSTQAGFTSAPFERSDTQLVQPDVNNPNYQGFTNVWRSMLRRKVETAALATGVTPPSFLSTQICDPKNDCVFSIPWKSVNPAGTDLHGRYLYPGKTDATGEHRWYLVNPNQVTSVDTSALPAGSTIRFEIFRLEGTTAVPIINVDIATGSPIQQILSTAPGLYQWGYYSFKFKEVSNSLPPASYNVPFAFTVTGLNNMTFYRQTTMEDVEELFDIAEDIRIPALSLRLANPTAVISRGGFLLGNTFPTDYPFTSNVTWDSLASSAGSTQLVADKGMYIFWKPKDAETLVSAVREWKRFSDTSVTMISTTEFPYRVEPPVFELYPRDDQFISIAHNIPINAGAGSQPVLEAIVRTVLTAHTDLSWLGSLNYRLIKRDYINQALSEIEFIPQIYENSSHEESLWSWLGSKFKSAVSWIAENAPIVGKVATTALPLLAAL